MLIDWFTVIAQVINFLILVWLLKHFLYRPILDAIDAREKKIASELSDAAVKKSEALKERNQFLQQNEVFKRQHAELMTKAIEDATSEKRHLLENARQDIERLRLKQLEALNSEQQSSIAMLNRRMRDEVNSILRKVLIDLSGLSLEEHVIEVFISRLRLLDDSGINRLNLAFMASDNPMVISTVFDLPLELRKRVESVIKEIFGESARTEFTIAPDLICGIELNANGQKLSWNIAGYLDALGKDVDELMNIRFRSEAEDKSNHAQNGDEHGNGT